ncbi:ATP-binding protein [Mammaliicoccus sciuri]|uniref:ATP-binding protein n=1 Tax=Mammaliicoccus sciuri TaxID=1296 RepID=UPI00195056E0|nr:ATP-binding protein [Mammaliicoccus sciuri]
MMYKTPCKLIQDNLMLTNNGQIWAYYKIKPKQIPLANTEMIENHKKNWFNAIGELSRYKDIHISTYPTYLSIEERIKPIRNDIHEDYEYTGNRYLDRQKEELTEQIGTPTSNQLVMGVRLKQSIDDVGDIAESAMSAISDVTQKIFGLLGYQSNKAHEVFETVEEENRIVTSTLGGINAQRLSEDEMIYINRYAFLRDIDHSLKISNVNESNINNTVIDPSDPGYLYINALEGKTCMTSLVLDEMPINMTDIHLSQVLDELPFPIEFHIKAVFKNSGVELTKSQRKNNTMKETDSDMYESGLDEDSKVSISRYLLSNYTDTIKNHKGKPIHWLGTIVVTGADKEECKHNAKVVKDVMKKISDTEVQQPLAQQLQLFYKNLPGEPLGVQNDYVQMTLVNGISELLFGLNKDIGTKTGFYIGRYTESSSKIERDEVIDISNDLVFFHPFLINENIKGANKSPHILISGDTGGGKSFLIKLMMMFLSLLEVDILNIDPKKEVRYWFTLACEDEEIQRDYPEFIEMVSNFNFYTLDSADTNNHGAFDPLVFLDHTQAKDVAIEIIENIYNLENKDDVSAEINMILNDLIDRKANGEKIGMYHLLDNLESSELTTAQHAGRLLKSIVRNSVLELCFSYGEKNTISLDGHVNIIELDNFDFPKMKNEKLSTKQKQSLAVLSPLAKFCELFGMYDRNQKTSIIFDEAWMLTKNSRGDKAIDSLKRVGRSYSNQVWLGTQAIDDAKSNDDDETKLFGTSFCFDLDGDRKNILNYLRLEDNETNNNTLKNLSEGQCMFKDPFGRVGKITIHCLFDEWLKAFKTVEKSKTAQYEESLNA